jgi:uncharacterized membrane protein required for colicin V production
MKPTKAQLAVTAVMLPILVVGMIAGFVWVALASGWHASFDIAYQFIVTPKSKE